jgi:transcription elongation factor Elf1
MAILNAKSRFPCPVCAVAREARITKKNKPYITCDPCGIQLFIRGPDGIAAFKRLTDTSQSIWERLAEMEQRYFLRCSECGHRFWIEPQLAKTSVFDGSLQGFRCPDKNCREVVPWKTKE